MNDVSSDPLRALARPTAESGRGRDDDAWVFTHYLASLDAAGEPADSAAFERVWQALRRLLAREIQRRGLWRMPPSFLGVFGFRTWAGNPGGDALDELTADCYAFVFVERLRLLRAQLARKPNVEGLVVRSVRNFLYDVQKRQDPLGFRIYDLTHLALRRALEAGELHLVGGGPGLGGRAVLACRAGHDAAAADPADLAPLVASWNDELLPGLITAHGKAKAAVVEQLRRRSIGLSEAGVEAFRVRDLVGGLKSDARARWAAVLSWAEGGVAVEGEDGEMVRWVRQIRPDTRFEDRQSFDRLQACITEGVEQQRLDRRTHGHLRELWSYLRTFAAEAPIRADHGRKHGGDDDQLPSRRELSRRLGIPRDRFGDLYLLLQGIWESCFRAESESRQL